MSRDASVYIIAEGKTERRFVNELLAPYMADKGVYLMASILGGTGRKGGDVRFSRAIRDIGGYLKQRGDTKISMLVDYYGIGTDWPGYAKSKKEKDHTRKAAVMNQATADEVQRLFPERNRHERFIPYVSMHEIEALYFSDPTCIAKHLNVKQKNVDAILRACEEPEKINDQAASAPSKRLEKLSVDFSKASVGIEIALEIGIPTMRKECPLFDDWLKRLEALTVDA